MGNLEKMIGLGLAGLLMTAFASAADKVEGEAACSDAACTVEAPAAPAIATPVLTLDQVREDRDVWPAAVAVVEDLEFSDGSRFAKGQELLFHGFHGESDVLLQAGQDQFYLPAEYVDLVERANSVASGKAAKEGFRGRIAEHLAGRLESPKDELQKAAKDDIAGADIYVFYLSSSACGWCKRFTPEALKAVQTLHAKYPGKLRFIHASADASREGYEPYVRAMAPDLALPPRDPFFHNEFRDARSANGPINMPAILVFNANGRLLAYAQREDRNMDRLASTISDLGPMLADSSKYTPSWMKQQTGSKSDPAEDAAAH